MDAQFLRQLKNTLFIDIETVAQKASYEEVEERLQKHWNRKASYLKNEENHSEQDLYKERAAIYAEFGKVVCIGFGAFYQDEDGNLAFRTKSLANHDEKQLLTDFKELLEKHKAKNNLLLCAHNGKEFDYPYLCRRMLIHQIQLPTILQLAGKKAWNVAHLDTLEMWKFGDYKSFTSLDLLATIFEIPSSKTDIDGSQVNQVYYENNDLEKIQRYCVADVVVLAQLYLRLNGYDIIPEEQIIRVN